jgi:hypothetical protein
MTQKTTTHIHCDVCEKEIDNSLMFVSVPFKYYLDQVAAINIQVSVDIFGHKGHICESCFKEIMRRYLNEP